MGQREVRLSGGQRNWLRAMKSRKVWAGVKLSEGGPEKCERTKGQRNWLTAVESSKGRTRRAIDFEFRGTMI
jgi:hypothetical protein